jgi:cytoskeleton protein RodZ
VAATEPPVTASLAPPLGVAATAQPSAAPTAVAPLAEVVLRFHGDSWVDIVDRKGAHIERGLVAAGAERRYTDGSLAEVTLGDSTAVEVSSGGVAVDLSPYREAKVAHFTVSSDGRIGASSSD